MKKRFAILAVTACTFALTFAAAGCAPSADSPSDANESRNYTADSLIAQHESISIDIASLTEVSVAACTGSGCHGGSWEALAAENEGMWEGIGQIPDANPHSSHASNAYECADCHSLESASTNQCNQCHVFETPEGWNEIDKTTTIYGPANNEPTF